MRNKSELIKRYIFFLVGIWCNAVGVALITKSALGTGPTTSIPYVLSLAFPLSFGSFTFLFNIILLLIQIILLRSNFKKYQLMQLPVSFLFAACIDVAMEMFKGITANHYYVAIFLVLAGCVIRALGVSCQVVADVVMLSSEAFVKAIADVTGKEFSLIKFINDALMTIIALIIAFTTIGYIEGIREGTLIAAFLIGPISHVFTRQLRFTNHYFEHEGSLVYEAKLKLKEGKRLVVTITSEAGSGGRVIAKILGALLNVPVYDKELVALVAKEGNFSTDYVRKHNERLYANVVEAFFLENYTLVEGDMESYRQLFNAQRRVIERLAQEQDCIIVGHCSNYLLREVPGSLHIHICTDKERRIRYMQDKYNINVKKALDMIERQDNDMHQYYMHFTGEDWKEAANYHMTMNSALFGYEGTAEMIEQIVKKNYMEMPKAKLKEVIHKYHLERK